uniref:AAA domain-containing protein n=1 Tax=Rodentolepis nana TaxID=102285 RepID=A0A0R3TC18_RODNA
LICIQQLCYVFLFFSFFPPSSNHVHPDSISTSLSDRDNEEAGRSDRYTATSRPLQRPTSRRNDHSEEQLEESYRRQAADLLRPLNFKSTEEKAPLRNRFIPNAGGTTTSVEPIECFDSNVTFDEVAGLHEQIQTLRESVVLPLVYPELFQSKTIEPPRGVLFHGPPGTGKTLLARALANECTRMSSGEGLASTIPGVSAANARPIAFFMRKGADVLSKWVGETERMLRDLFEEAHRLKPSIIFFDELDGLAPVRSSRQDQVHSSIVATLLSLMDGLDRRPGVVVIGATNRPDAIDPALRRPGRFDREFHFKLPNMDTRRRILQINTAKWDPKPDDQLLDYLASETTGYCGADMKALTTEACLCCLRRQYPQIYESKVKLDIDLKYLVVSLPLGRSSVNTHSTLDISK